MPPLAKSTTASTDAVRSVNAPGSTVRGAWHIRGHASVLTTWTVSADGKAQPARTSRTVPSSRVTLRGSRSAERDINTNDPGFAPGSSSPDNTRRLNSQARQVRQIFRFPVNQTRRAPGNRPGSVPAGRDARNSMTRVDPPPRSVGRSPVLRWGSRDRRVDALPGTNVT